MSIKLAWDFVVLFPLSDGKPMHLKGVYAFIEEQRRHGGVMERLFGVDGRWGEDRPDYAHTVRSTMSSLKKRGMVKHLRTGKGRTGMYQITDAGRKRLTEVEP
jgi:hypothetical protein